MKKFRFMNMLVAAALLTGFTACSNEVDGIESEAENPQDANGYIKMSITVPNGAGGETRANTNDESDDGTDVGTANEYAVKNVTLYLFKANDLTYDTNYTGVFESSHEYTTISDATDEATNKKVYTVTGKIKTGKYHVYVVVNGKATMSLTPGTTTEKNFLADVNTTKYTGVVAPDDISSSGIQMASRTMESTASYPYRTLEITSSNSSESAAAEMEVEVERVMGRLTLKAKSANNSYDVNGSKGGKIATVEITNYKIVNPRNSFYTFRHTNTSSTGAVADDTYGLAGTNYVMDPKTASKTLTGSTMANDYTSWYGTATAYAAMPTETSSKTVIGYCNENTIPQNNQVNGYSTGVIFKAKVTPEAAYKLDGGTVKTGEAKDIADATVFYYNPESEKFYLSLEALNKDLNLSLTDETLHTYKIQKYQGGVCYYKYWIKHLPQAGTTMGPMEFAIVRNNTYDMMVESVSGMGEGSTTNDVVITPADPDKINDIYIKVTLKVMPWIVRTNNIIL